MGHKQITDIRERFAWAFEEPDPGEIVASMKEDARRVLSATTSPPVYRTAPDPEEDD
jgi:hypothetical protein